MTIDVTLQGESEMEEVMSSFVTFDSHIQGENYMLEDLIQEKNARRLDQLDLKKYSMRDKIEKAIMQFIPGQNLL